MIIHIYRGIGSCFALVFSPISETSSQPKGEGHAKVLLYNPMYTINCVTPYYSTRADWRRRLKMDTGPIGGGGG
jgi:hypothetical protein